MSHLPHEELYLLWEQFVAGGNKITGIRKEVSDSWLRCRAMGLNPSQKSSQVDLTKHSELLSKNALLVEVAFPFLDLVAKMIYGTGFIGVLGDKDGYVLELRGDEDAVKFAKENNFDICANRLEQTVGTNAISLALSDDRAFQIVGPEHYNFYHHNWTCSAAPIHDTSGSIIGVLNLSGHYSLIHKHTLGMVVSLVQAIERELRLWKKSRSLKLANEHLKAVIDSVSDGVIAVDRKGMITEVNSKLLRLFQMGKINPLGKKASEVFKGHIHLLEALDAEQDYVDCEDFFTVDSRKLSFVTTARQIRNEQNQVVGVVGILKEKKEVFRMINKMIGSKAIFTFGDIIYNSPEMESAIKTARTVAETDSRVLLEGESGTGKELFAQAIHNASDRHAGPFVALNCSAIPRELIESELFGYSEGAFTGAKKGGSTGKFELASGGTLFLDEVSSMPLEMQAKLLRVLQQNEITRVGGSETINVDVRIIAASNESIEELVNGGHFRLDLFYRLGVVVIKIPPLRERIQDIPVLFCHLFDSICKKIGKEIKYSEDEIMKLLGAYHWPGNVRELENYIERAVVLARGCTLTEEHFPDKVIQSSNSHGNKGLKPLEKTEKEIIEKAMKMFQGNISKVSKNLEISRNTLYSRIKEYNIQI